MRRAHIARRGGVIDYHAPFIQMIKLEGITDEIDRNAQCLKLNVGKCEILPFEKVKAQAVFLFPYPALCISNPALCMQGTYGTKNILRKEISHKQFIIILPLYLSLKQRNQKKFSDDSIHLGSPSWLSCIHIVVFPLQRQMKEVGSTSL